MRKVSYTSVLALVLTVSAHAVDGVPDPVAPTWDRTEALAIAATADLKVEKIRLQSYLDSGDSAGALELLRGLELRAELAAPGRERLLLDFVNGLRREPPGSVSGELLEYLKAYRSEVLVADMDHPRALVPLFRVGSAAHGVQNAWTRMEARYQGAVYLEGNPEKLVSAYLHEAGVPVRSGLVDSLEGASPTARMAVARAALQGVAEHPELFTLAARAAMLNGDLATLVDLLKTGSHPEMARLMQRSQEYLNRNQVVGLFSAALDHGTHETAALAIAVLTPSLAGDQEIENLLVSRLGHPQLGAPVALALAKGASPETLGRVRAIASSPESSLATERARMTLTLRNGLAGEGSPR